MSTGLLGPYQLDCSYQALLCFHRRTLPSACWSAHRLVVFAPNSCLSKQCLSDRCHSGQSRLTCWISDEFQNAALLCFVIIIWWPHCRWTGKYYKQQFLFELSLNYIKKHRDIQAHSNYDVVIQQPFTTAWLRLRLTFDASGGHFCSDVMSGGLEFDSFKFFFMKKIFSFHWSSMWSLVVRKMPRWKANTKANNPMVWFESDHYQVVSWMKRHGWGDEFGKRDQTLPCAFERA